MFRRCRVLRTTDTHWLVRCADCNADWLEPADGVIVAVTCPHCNLVQGVLYPGGVAYRGPLVEGLTDAEVPVIPKWTISLPRPWGI